MFTYITLTLRVFDKDEVSGALASSAKFRGVGVLKKPLRSSNQDKYYFNAIFIFLLKINAK